ncbi:MAG TPA: Asd/ArgC dimerization domain-containing protein, partial [Actinomycetes bacterium]|nr:Asd/ArgC dimerization domain-containing protein [Actinomycetes bacterium]
AGASATVSFTPILAPMPRGILATVTMRAADGVGDADLREAMLASYADEPFVHLLAEGQWPRTADVYGSNSAHIQVALDEHAHRVVVVTAIDNLGKGAAGQAIQNVNLMLGFDETTGLSVEGIAP